jgi:hypothetical protein
MIHIKQLVYDSLHALRNVRKKWVSYRLMPPLSLFHLAFNLCSTTLAQRTGNCADDKGWQTRRARNKRNLHFGVPRTSLSQAFQLGKARQRRAPVSTPDCAG